MNLRSEIAMLWAVLTVFALAMVIVGKMERTDAKLNQLQYCNNVRDGVWPDYERGRYKLECGGNEPPPFNEDLTK